MWPGGYLKAWGAREIQTLGTVGASGLVHPCRRRDSAFPYLLLPTSFFFTRKENPRAFRVRPRQTLDLQSCFAFETETSEGAGEEVGYREGTPAPAKSRFCSYH